MSNDEVAVFLLIFVFSFGYAVVDKKYEYCQKRYGCGYMISPPKITSMYNSVCKYGCQPKEGTIPKNITPFFRKRCLHYVNYYRNKLAGGELTEGGNGPAANMNAVSYNMELEFIAACWNYVIGIPRSSICSVSLTLGRVALTASWLHHKGEPVDDKGIKLYFEKWYRQGKLYSKENIDRYSPPKGKDASDFGVMMWATNTDMGCAWSTTDYSVLLYYVVCAFGPGADQGGYPIYLRGDGATLCLPGKSKNKEFPNLCGDIKPLPPEAKKTGKNPLWDKWIDKYGKRNVKPRWKYGFMLYGNGTSSRNLIHSNQYMLLLLNSPLCLLSIKLLI